MEPPQEVKWSYSAVTGLESSRLRLIVSWTMLVLRTKSWMEKVAGKSDHSSLHHEVMFLDITDKSNIISMKIEVL